MNLDSATSVSHLSGPLVYAVYGSNLLYIGSGGIGRAFSSMKAKGGTDLKIIQCATREEAYELEATLIREHNPPLNWFIPKHNGRPAERINKDKFKVRTHRSRRYDKLLLDYAYSITGGRTNKNPPTGFTP